MSFGRPLFTGILYGGIPEVREAVILLHLPQCVLKCGRFVP